MKPNQIKVFFSHTLSPYNQKLKIWTHQSTIHFATFSMSRFLVLFYS